jgi:serine/threonine protein kinase
MPLYVRTLQQLALQLFSHVPLPPVLLLRVLADVLGALLLLHAARLAHCDVKADNVMLTAEGRAVLIDLASATPFGQDMEEGLPPELTLGFSGPAAPEQDVHGLACMLWALLHEGRLPLSGSRPAQLAAQLQAELEEEAGGGSAAGRALMGLLTGRHLRQVRAEVIESLGGEA